MKSLLTITSIIGMNMLAGGIPTLTPVDGFPNGEAGIDQGVSACFAGGFNDFIVMAGGCNFPVNTLAPDSKKRFYKDIYVAHTDTSDRLVWTKVGTLPQAMAYGVAVTYGNSMIIAGGTNDNGSVKDVYSITIADGKALVDTLPSLPCTLDNMAGAMVEGRFYLAGGNADGKPSNRVLRLDMDNTAKGWEEIAPFPGIARVQPVAGCAGKGRFCLFGGFKPADGEEKAELAFDGCIYDTATESWTTAEGATDDNGEKIFLGGGIAQNVTDDSMIVVGGVNKDVFLSALNNPQPDYLSHPIEWYRFNPYTLLYIKGEWKIIAKSDVTARAGATLALTERGMYVIGGELKPRVRTPHIYLLEPTSKQ